MRRNHWHVVLAGCLLTSLGCTEELLDPPAREGSPEITVPQAAIVGANTTFLPSLPGSVQSFAQDINDAGRIVGFVWAAGNSAQHAFLWSASDGIQDLGTLGGIHSGARAINEAGEIAGWSYLPGNNAQHAVRWTPGGMQDLGTLGGTNSFALGINDAGHIVGISGTTGNLAQHAFLWTSGGGMQDLGTLGGTFGVALSISSAGHVVGGSTTTENVQHAFLWTPEEGMQDLYPTTGLPFFEDINSSLQAILGNRVVQLIDEPSNQPPTASVGGPYTGTEGTPVTFALGGSDPDAGDDLTFEWNLGDGTTGSGATPPASHTYTDNGTYAVSLTVRDSHGEEDTKTTTASMANVAPTATLGGPTDPVPVGAAAAVPLTVSFTDPGSADKHTLSYRCDAAQPFSTPAAVTTPASFNCAYTQPGVYVVTAQVQDDDGGSHTVEHRYVVVFDPSAGFVTGGGWINYGAIACAELCSTAGRGDFAFSSKYQKGKSVPTGDIQFQLDAGTLSFTSTSYDWLVVAGSRGQFKGVGTINGGGDYGFLLTAIDGGKAGIDAFRIKIWDRATDVVVFDNQRGQDETGSAATQLDKVNGGGSIVIHSK